MSYRILVIDDDKSMHLITKRLLGKEFDLVAARNAQEAIDLLAEEQVNLVLSDIHMPGLSGLEFLESLMKDTEKQQIPVLIMTNLPSVEKEQKALNLGAADFLDKSLFMNDREEVLRRIRMKLVTSIDVSGLNDDLVKKKNRLVGRIMTEAIRNDFSRTVNRLCLELKDQFNIDYVAYWALDEHKPSLVCAEGEHLPEAYGVSELSADHGFTAFLEDSRPYLTNHVFNEDKGIMLDFARAKELPAEIGVPLFNVDERKLLMNRMQVPDGARMFGFMVMKRNRLFTSKEYEVISRLLVQTGSILWRLYSKK